MTNCGGIFDLASLKSQIQTLEARMAAPDFWGDRRAAQSTIRKKNLLERELKSWGDMERRLDDLRAMVELAESEHDASLEEELAAEQIGRAHV